MKVEISEDQNTLTVDGVEYEAKIEFYCKGCAFSDTANYGICMIRPMSMRKCTEHSRLDEKSIIWIKKEKNEN